MRAVIGTIMGIMIAFMIGLIIISTLINSVDTSGWDGNATRVWGSLTSNIWTVFGLLVILPLVIGAVVLLRLFGGGGFGGG